MEVKNWQSVLAQAIQDNAVGISIAYLSGNEEFSMYVTEIKPNSQVGAHYHSKGVEIYQILEGQGVIHIGEPLKDAQVAWVEEVIVKKGDFFTILPGQVHQLKNPYKEKLVLVFGCPSDHLSSDRVVIK
jgi:mannose-6-phosphate isomerase-like protein (cupin superfamily)